MKYTKIARIMATNVVIVYLNIDLIQYCIKTYQMWVNRQTKWNVLSELINPFGSVTKQTKWIRTDRLINDPSNSISKESDEPKLKILKILLIAQLHH